MQTGSIASEALLCLESHALDETSEISAFSSNHKPTVDLLSGVNNLALALDFSALDVPLTHICC